MSQLTEERVDSCNRGHPKDRLTVRRTVRCRRTTRGPYGGYYPPPARPTNTLAIISLVCAFVFAPADVICGIIARKQIKETGEQGDGLALAGIIISVVQIALFILIFVFVIVFNIALLAIFAQLPDPSTSPSQFPSPVPTF